MIIIDEFNLKVLAHPLSDSDRKKFVLMLRETARIGHKALFPA
jgi:hypothetical protein